MLRKSFISVYFSSNKIYILQLDGHRKKVRNFGSGELPTGLVKNFRVQDKSGLTGILRAIWDTNSRLKEKSIGIIISEFSTYTKLFDLPKLPFSELNEAVGWQAQETLPAPMSDMVMDWMVVDQESSRYEVLAVAMEKSILAGFVKGAEEAGLFPLAVQIPSLCLVRVTEGSKSSGRLIIYKSSSETILVVAYGSKVFGTSVLNTDDRSSIVKTASKITSHYKNNVEVEKILIGGTGMDSKLIQQLENSLEREIEWIRPDIKGLSEMQIQEYLIPICMQLSDLEEPSDPYSLNLLPLGLVTKYKRAHLALQIWSLTLTITLFIWIAFLVSCGSYLYMMQQISDLKTVMFSEAEATKQIEETDEDVLFINDIAARVLEIKSVSVSPREVINDIKKAAPSGVDLKKFDLDLDRGIVEVSGRAATRQVLLEFKKNVESNSDTASVEIPISSFEKEVDLGFQLTFVYLPVRKVENKENK